MEKTHVGGEGENAAVAKMRFGSFVGKGQLAFFVAMCAVGTLCATTWHVNQTSGDDVAAAADATGNTSFKTIQAAMAVVKAEDIVRVDPGTYTADDGYTTDTDGGFSTIYVPAKITLESTGSRDDTFIEGRWDTATDSEHGIGPDAVRCVCLATEAKGSVIRGFTFRRGATHAGGDVRPNSGGGFYDWSKGQGSYVEDCAFDHCSGTRGGGMRYGTAVRTIFRDCYASNYGSGAREASLFFCLFTRCAGAQVVAYVQKLAQCTFSGNSGTLLHADPSGTVYNCALVSGSTSASKISWQGSVTYHTSFSGTAAGNCQTRVFGAGVFSPLFGDYSPYAGGDLVGSGDESARDIIPANYQDKDLYGNPVDWTAGKLSAGAVQTVKTPVGGRAIFANNNVLLTVDGVPVAESGSGANANVMSNYTFETCWPTQHLVQALANGSYTPLRMDLYVDGSADTDQYARPLLDLEDQTWVTVPQEGTALWIPLGATTCLWVDAAAADPDGANGSEAKPYATIQAALDAGTASLRVIKVKAGRYDSGTGPTDLHGHANRVEISRNGYTRLMGVDGAEQTFIVGASDPAADAAADGCGPNAVRCVATAASCLIQGFTLTGGRTSVGAENTSDGAALRGGAIICDSSYENISSASLSDCIITDNVGFRAGAGFAGRYVRCRFTNNRTLRFDSLLDGSVLVVSCHFEGNTAQGGIVERGRVYHSTLIATGRDNVPYAGNLDLYNSIVMAECAHRDTPDSTSGTLTWGFTPANSSPRRGDPCFISATDRRVANVSQAVGLGNVNIYRWWRFVCSDITGRRLTFTDGKPVSGAYQEVLPAVALGAQTAVVTGPGETATPPFVLLDSVPSGLTFVAVDAGVRPFLGFAVDGEPVPASGTDSNFTCTATAELSGHVIAAIYGTDWYVNAATGDDKAFGSSPETARRTLAGALSCAQTGDTVHVAEGTYAEGWMLHTTPCKGTAVPYIRSRAVVPGGVTLVADGERENTVILGAVDPDYAADTTRLGCGPNAMRCLMVEANARVCGFTLRGGRTDWVNQEDDNNHAGGVLARHATQSVIEDCTIEDCRSQRGGGSRYGLFRRCRFLGNYAQVNSAAGREGCYYGCFFEGQRGANVLAFYVNLSCCTFGTDNLSATGGNAEALGEPNKANAFVYGCLFTRKSVAGANSSAVTFVNCAFGNDAVLPTAGVFTDCVYAPRADLAQLDDRGCPLAGLNPACDAGLLEHWTACGNDAETDALGNPRLANAAMDIGCLEADWKACYAAELARGNCLTFTAAEPRAHLEAPGEVFLPQGALTGKITVAREGRFVFPVRLTGNGTLTVTVADGEPIVLAGPLAQGEISFRTAAGESAIAFAYAPGVDDAGGVYLGRGGRMTGLGVSIR
ncbi:MAG: hypothetical protein MJ240_11925 [Kiritimatiellae bacterium]|nr:hypothetical protein [Kiritimatiellia bacterium]